MPRSTSRAAALPTVADILEAAEWRLADWSYDEMANAQPIVEIVWEIFRNESGFSSEDDRIKPHLDSIRRSDRREPWTALCSLLALESDARGYTAGTFQAGFFVLHCFSQAGRGHAKRAQDCLDELAMAYLKNNPASGSGEIFNHFVRLAGKHPAIESANTESLTYVSGLRTKTVSRATFAARLSRARKRIASQTQPQSATLENIFLRSYLQPVDVMAKE